MGGEDDFDIDLGEEIFDEDYDNLLDTPGKSNPNSPKHDEPNVDDAEEDEDEDDDGIEEDFTADDQGERAVSSGRQGIEALPPMKDNADIASEHKETASQHESDFESGKQQFERGEGFEYASSPEPLSRQSSARSHRSSRSQRSHRSSRSRRSSANSSLGSNAEETIQKLTQTNQRLRDQLVKLSRTLDHHLQQKGIRMRKKSAHHQDNSSPELKSIHRQLKMYRKANADLKQKLYSSDNVEKIAQLKNNLREQKMKIKKLNDEIRSLNNITREQSKQLEVLDNGNEDIIQKNENAIRVQKAEARKYRTENKKLLDKLNKMQRQLLRSKTENDKYKDLLTKHDMTVDAAAEIEALRKQLDDEKKKSEDAERKVAISQKALDSLKRRQIQESKRYKHDKTKLKQEIGDLENKIAHHRFAVSGSHTKSSAAATPRERAESNFESKIPKAKPARRRKSAAAPKKRSDSATKKKNVSAAASRIPKPKKKAPAKSPAKKKTPAKSPAKKSPKKEEIRESKDSIANAIDENIDDLLDENELNFDDDDDISEAVDVDVDIDNLLEEAKDSPKKAVKAGGGDDFDPYKPF
mmetsp:Transcript_4096/g.6067  ORF Transcript_4096/g.6067 Transcript_4096/m.6067 type:complete len:582 (+) Transcript_4096:177-1922(+)|eukprot:CAMPEP_0117423682 /NCGR_PEP_ID=MMETSP0758-20121206/4246_1 /TAXON_ID=63605 /ORGANISM="Percolomonas cosmopolitus, Strain AE-1 (ATCC 50343)" /LENGTH=581 /DNA_ID=CAMNT_0005206995 /DNA_START=701 /DNA_END=2446 /DNA_ORIENTATION=+